MYYSIVKFIRLSVSCFCYKDGVVKPKHDDYTCINYVIYIIVAAQCGILETNLRAVMANKPMTAQVKLDLNMCKICRIDNIKITSLTYKKIMPY